ncbi:MAG: glycosyl hydrolase 53 family protein [Chitinispirillaceae bacterium]|nr:glycosyl hydrolase 53 family protein [Chitinispirillaceae bacterium]
MIRKLGTGIGTTLVLMAVLCFSSGASAAKRTEPYMLGVDISFVGTQPAQTRVNLLNLLKEHGINAVRLRTFVDPKAADGYDKTSGACDLAHTIAFGKQVKAAGMSFLVDFHYSDNWADPGKQCVPIIWQKYTTIAQLAQAVHDYTKDAITQLIAGGARPDMVQIGNETTPGMLIHRCDSKGEPTGTNPVNGSTSNWANLGALLKAGVDAVKEVDPKIMTSFHIAKGGDHTDGKAALSTSVTWLTNALKYTTIDAFGESCYATYQGDKTSATKTKMIWQTVQEGLVAKFPNIKIFAAEIGGFIREINDVNFNLPNQAGIGTFFWEATMSSSSWNTGALVTQSGSTYVPTSQLALYDQMYKDYGLAGLTNTNFAAGPARPELLGGYAINNLSAWLNGVEPLRYTAPAKSSVEIKLYNSAGRLMGQLHTEGMKGVNSVNSATMQRTLPPGYYIVSLVVHRTVQATQGIVKQE